MSPVWHIIQKDFRRLALPLGLWAVLLAAKGEVGVRVLTGHAADGGRLFYWSIANTTLLWLDAAVCVLLVAALVHEDTLVGTGSGWVTRPISGGRLLAAKLLGAGLMFGVLPIVVAVRWWMVCGYGGAELVRAALAIADMQVVTVFGALLVAVLTKNINEFLGWALGLGLALIVGGFVPSVFVKGSWLELTRGVFETRTVLVLPVVALGGATVIAIQFFSRRRAWALRVAAVSAGLVAIVFAGGWDFSAAWKHAPQTSLLASGITITVENPTLDRQGAMKYVLRGVPMDFGVRVLADHVWRWSDGASVEAMGSWSEGSWPGSAEWRSLWPHAGNENAIRMQAYAASGPKGAPPPDTLVVPSKFLLLADKAERLRAEPADYTGELHIEMLRPTLEFELPLRDGEERERAGVTVRIDRAVWRPDACTVTLVESRPQLRRALWRRPSIAKWVAAESGPATMFALVNRARGEAVKLWPTPNAARLIVGTQELVCYTLGCDLPRDPAAERSDAPPAWLNGATLAVVRYHEEASFDRLVKIEKFGAPGEGTAAK